MKKLVLPGALILLAGVYLLLSRLPGVDLPMGSFLSLMGAGFLVVRAVTRKYGWSFAAFPLLFIGAGWVLVRFLSLSTAYISVATLLGLSLAFFLIHICEFRRIGNWPMLPAVLLLLGGIAALALVTPDFRRSLQSIKVYLLPSALILLGVALLIVGIVAYGRASRKQKPQGAPYTPPDTPPQPENEPAEPAQQEKTAEKEKEPEQEEETGIPIILGETTESAKETE